MGGLTLAHGVNECSSARDSTGSGSGWRRSMEGVWRVWFSFYELGVFEERERSRLRPSQGPSGREPLTEPGVGLDSGFLRLPGRWPSLASAEESFASALIPRTSQAGPKKCYLCAWHKVLPMTRSAHNTTSEEQISVSEREKCGCRAGAGARPYKRYDPCSGQHKAASSTLRDIDTLSGAALHPTNSSVITGPESIVFLTGQRVAM